MTTLYSFQEGLDVVKCCRHVDAAIDRDNEHHSVDDLMVLYHF